MRKILLFITITLSLTIGYFAVDANAITSTSSTTTSSNSTVTGSGQALEIGPPTIIMSGNPGQILTTSINLRDISSSKLIVTGQVNDFEASSQEDGTPKIILDDTIESSYSLKKWISPFSTLTLNPKQLKTFPVTIKIPANASPGGYYGVVRFTSKAPDLNDTGVALSASLGSLLMIRVNGDAKENVTTEEFYVSSDNKKSTIFESTPIQLTERFKNNGNVDEAPTGQISISDMFGKKIANVNINLDGYKILPNSIRKYSQVLDYKTIGTKKLFGRYTAEMKVTYGSKKEVITSKITFWVVPYRMIGMAIVALIGAFIALRFLIKRYNKHITSKYEKSKSKAKK